MSNVGMAIKKGSNRIIDTEEGKAKIDKFIKYLGRGNYIETACKVAGLTRKVFYDWAESARNGDPQYIELMERVEQAQAEAEADKVNLISVAAKDDWRAAAWWLERVYRDRWGVDTKLIIEQKVENQLETLMAEIQAALPANEFKKLMARINQHPEEREDLVSKEIDGATNVKDAEIVDED